MRYLSTIREQPLCQRPRGAWRVAGGFLVVFAIAAGLLLSGCKQGSSPDVGGKLRVVCTTTMVADLVRRVGGDRIDVRVIMGAGVDPHTYKPTPGDIAELSAAPIIFYNGLHLEGKMVDLFEKELKSKAHALAAAVPEDRLLGWKNEEGGVHDPHIWFDVGLWAAAVPMVQRELSAKDPGGADLYQKNGQAFADSLAALDQSVRARLASVPAERRELITSHDAYSYFGKTYDVKVHGLQGISTETEAGLREINQAVQFIVERKIPAVFVETSVSHKTIERVIADCRSRGWEVKHGGELYSDAMGNPGERPGYAVETYEGMVNYNVDTIVSALK